MKRKDNGVQLPWNDDSFISEWQIWLQFRSERRLPTYKPTGLKRTFEMLKQISGDNPQTAIAIINQSIANNWQGLFPLKNINNGQINQGSIGNKPVPQTVPSGRFGQF